MKIRTALKPGVWDATVSNVIAGGEQAAVEITVKSETYSRLQI
jgi:hypothetical protein